MRDIEMMVEVSAVRWPDEPGPHTVMLATGTVVGSPERVTFAGDRRMMQAMADALAQGDSHVIAVIAPWQVVSGLN